jgi:hypothetical protein
MPTRLAYLGSQEFSCRAAGLFARANAVNTNNRLYPKRILLREVKKFIKEQVATCCALGELDHPSYMSSTFKHFNLVNVSHQVLSMKWKGNSLWGFIEVCCPIAPQLSPSDAQIRWPPSATFVTRSPYNRISNGHRRRQNAIIRHLFGPVSVCPGKTYVSSYNTQARVVRVLMTLLMSLGLCYFLCMLL